MIRYFIFTFFLLLPSVSFADETKEVVVVLSTEKSTDQNAILSRLSRQYQPKKIYFRYVDDFEQMQDQLDQLLKPDETISHLIFAVRMNNFKAPHPKLGVDIRGISFW